MNTITTDDINKAFSLMKWISPRANPNLQIWNNKIPLMQNSLYKIEKNKQIVMLFFQVEDLTEVNFKKIYKKRFELNHLDLMVKNSGNKWTVIWELKK